MSAPPEERPEAVVLDERGRAEPSPDEELPDIRPPQRGRLRFDRLLNGFVPVVGLAACCFFLAQAKTDLRYLTESSRPVDLGGPQSADGRYHFESARPGLFAKISGTVRGDGARYQHGFAAGKVWPLSEAPVLVERRDFNPRHGAIQAEGMLKIDDQLAPEYRPVIRALQKGGVLGLAGPDVGTAHTWVLVEGHTPHGLDGLNLYLGLLLILAALNGWWVVRPVLRR